MRLRAVAAVSGATLALAAAAAPANAAQSCTYDAASRTVTATLESPYTQTFSVDSGGAIKLDYHDCGEATTANTDRVVGTGTPGNEVVTIDEGGPGGPFTKPGGSDEIRFDIDLGKNDMCYPDYCHWVPPQLLSVTGTPGDDHIRAGRADSILVNLDDSDDDADISLAGDATLALDGAGGDDELVALGGNGTGTDPVDVTVHGGEDDDHVVTGGHTDTIFPGPGDDTINSSPSRHDVVTYEDAPGGVTANLGTGVVSDDGFGDTDRLDEDARHLRGSEHADHITAGGATPTFWRGVTVHGLGGDDVLVGTLERDHLLGGHGSDRITGAPPANAYGFPGDVIDGGPQDDVLIGSPFSDALLGGRGDDQIHARGGTDESPFGYPDGDWVEGGPGNDYLDGGRDRDVYMLDPAFSHETDTIVERAGGGRDTVQIGEYDPSLYFNSNPLTVEEARSHVDLSSGGREFGTTGRRTLRTPEPGGARQIENVLDKGFGPDDFVGSDAANRFEISDSGGRADCRGGRDAIKAPTGARVTNCEVVKRRDR